VSANWIRAGKEAAPGGGAEESSALIATSAPAQDKPVERERRPTRDAQYAPQDSTMTDAIGAIPMAPIAVITPETARLSAITTEAVAS
jgi:hypothetical protein